MSKVVRIDEAILSRLAEVDVDLNAALLKVLDNKQVGVVLKQEHIDRLNRINPGHLDSSLGVVLEAFFNRIDLDQARLSELQKQEVKMLIQEELWKAKGGY